MSDEYNDFYCQTLYGLFEMIIVEKLFKNNDKMSIKQLIDIVKNKYNDGITDEDKINIVIYTINYFIGKDNYNDLDEALFINKSLIKFILKNKITASNIIKKINNHNDIKISNLIRKIIYEICLFKNYKFLDDEKLLSFLYRTHKNLKFTGNYYKSLKNIDDLIENTIY
uniref:Uncharacterized protein n=1 Tax=viral metagenome TaxID=1070528 RepID=A0A6C0H9X1_9ZZZZ